ncbi:hypothetical protein SAMN05216559_1609 [Halomicrobium zhouii]|uniref:SpoIIAA-like n=1 Tax=Halomicrobium zhouii TaxID=767519 RepID=A0A1I6KZ30_9EURY|nr:hypothetical protein [Halomicrobium zhouii]SFR96471.1 hypothetical protein SAMN05216559_1609 [Halomicrobium zhouii]
MAPEVHTEGEKYTIEWDDDIGTLIHTWTAFASGEAFREGCNDLLAAVEERNATKMIVDTSNVKAHDEADKQWLQTEWTPKTVEAGVQATAMVRSDSVISEMEMKEMSENMPDDADGGPEALITDDMAEARDWMADQ